MGALASAHPEDRAALESAAAALDEGGSESEDEEEGEGDTEEEDVQSDHSTASENFDVQDAPHSSSKYESSVALFNPTPKPLTKHHLLHTKSHPSVEKQRKSPPFPSLAPKPVTNRFRQHKIRHFCEWETKRKVVVGKGDTKRARTIFKSAQKCHFLRVGDEEKCFVPMRGDDGKEWELGEDCFSLVSHTGREKGESGRDGNCVRNNEMFILFFTRYSK